MNVWNYWKWAVIYQIQRSWWPIVSSGWSFSSNWKFCSHFRSWTVIFARKKLFRKWHFRAKWAVKMTILPHWTNWINSEKWKFRVIEKDRLLQSWRSLWPISESGRFLRSNSAFQMRMAVYFWPGSNDIFDVFFWNRSSVKNGFIRNAISHSYESAIWSIFDAYRFHLSFYFGCWWRILFFKKLWRRQTGSWLKGQKWPSKWTKVK